MKSSQSFTLIELLIVIAIIGILASIIIVSMTNATNSANDARRKTDIATIIKNLAIYGTQSGDNYPIQAVQCNIGDDNASTGCTVLNPILRTYLPSIPKDPVSSSYYTYQSTDGVNFSVAATMSNGDPYLYNSAEGYMKNFADQSYGGTCTVSPNGCSTGSCWSVVDESAWCVVKGDIASTLTRTWNTSRYITKIEWEAGGTLSARIWYLDVYDGSSWQQVDSVSTQDGVLRTVNIGYNISAMRIRRNDNVNWHQFMHFAAY
ncbi:prepilin-type N-terminal cleavage/methylation domain-containing protein [bacterium]|nr:prepilin-type N-terminal cleavage/methylation domain-containing protein [bacterium]